MLAPPSRQYLNPELEKKIAAHEGYKQFLYYDSLKNATVGIGRCIELGKDGISLDEAYYLLRNDIDRCYRSLCTYPWFNAINDVRQGVIIEMTFNMGLAGLLQFKNMIEALGKKDFISASEEILNSKEASQIGNIRALDMADRMKYGNYS